MNILGSTQYVDLSKQEEPWYQLSVINMWDWSTESVCYQKINNNLITYCLYKCIPVSDDSYRREIVKELTEEMKEELISKEYIISKK